MDAMQFKLGIIWYIIFLFSLVLHEFAHAFAAYKLGDPTAFREGQVSLNPLPHLRREVFGTIIAPIISFIMAGWMVGWASTPYDAEWARRNMRKSAWMALAGPLANLALLLLAMILIRLGYSAGVFYAPDEITFSQITAARQNGLMTSGATVLSILFSLNLILLLFNLLPFPTFDGSSLLLFFVKGPAAQKVFQFINNPGLAIFSIIIAWNIFNYIFNPVHLMIVNLLYPGITYG